MQIAIVNRARREWYTVYVLSALQAISQSGQTMVMTVTAITGTYLTDDPALGTLPLALQFLATMITTIPASLMMARLGRRFGFVFGQAIGVVSALTAAYGIMHGSFGIFAAGSMGLGVHNAFWQYLRFAATEVVSQEKRARAISYVVAGGVVAALAGPWLATHTRDLLSPALFAGSYTILAVLAGVNILLLQMACFVAPETGPVARKGRPMSVILRQPGFVAAVMASATGYGVMIFVMTAAPLAMLHRGCTFADAAFVIQWHVLGMYVPSFFTGRLIERFGAQAIVGAGVFLNLLAVWAGMGGGDLKDFWFGLFAVGLGWNFMFVGGTALLTQTYRPEERAKVQALNDFLVFSTVALASFSSGALYSVFGWSTVNAVLAVPLLLVSAILGRSILRNRILVGKT